MDPNLSESHAIPLTLLRAPPPGPTSSISPHTPLPAVPRSLCQHLFYMPEHGRGTAGTICRHSEALCLADFEAAQPCEGLTEVTPTPVHGSQCCRTAAQTCELLLNYWHKLFSAMAGYRGKLLLFFVHSALSLPPKMSHNAYI